MGTVKPNHAGYYEFVDTDFSAIPLSHLDLTNARFKRCKFGGLYSADLTGARFTDCVIAGNDFRYARLTNASFDGCTLDHSIFSAARIDEGTTFSACSMREAQFYRAHIHGARFTGCNLYQTSFGSAELENVTFYRCNLAAAEFYRGALRYVAMLFSNTDGIDATANEFSNVTGHGIASIAIGQKNETACVINGRAFYAGWELPTNGNTDEHIERMARAMNKKLTNLSGVLAACRPLIEWSKQQGDHYEAA